MQVHLETILCKFGGDLAICLREEAVCAKVYRRTDRQTDRRTDDGRLAIVLAHSWNELIKTSNALVTLVKTKQDCLKKVLKTVRTTRRISNQQSKTPDGRMC